MFKFVATLPRDRVKPGLFFLLNPDGRLLMTGPCLGKADNARAAAEHNPARDPVLPYGDWLKGVLSLSDDARKGKAVIDVNFVANRRAPDGGRATERVNVARSTGLVSIDNLRHRAAYEIIKGKL